MLLRHDVEIVADSRDIFTWLERFDHYYLMWHKDHIACYYVKGDRLATGAVLICQEYLHGRPHRFRMRVTGVEPGSRVDYSVGPGMSGAFIVKPAGQGVRFTAEMRLGFALPLLGRLQDAIISRLAGWKISALEQHMAEEGENLKALIESGLMTREEVMSLPEGEGQAREAATVT